MNYKNKMTLSEFISHTTKDVTEHHARILVHELINPDSKHEGDCTEIPCTCELCLLQNYLDRYEKYFFNGKED